MFGLVGLLMGLFGLVERLLLLFLLFVDCRVVGFHGGCMTHLDLFSSVFPQHVGALRMYVHDQSKRIPTRQSLCNCFLSWFTCYMHASLHSFLLSSRWFGFFGEERTPIGHCPGHSSRTQTSSLPPCPLLFRFTYGRSHPVPETHTERTCCVSSETSGAGPDLLAPCGGFPGPGIRQEAHHSLW